MFFCLHFSASSSCKEAIACHWQITVFCSTSFKMLNTIFYIILKHCHSNKEWIINRSRQIKDLETVPVCINTASSTCAASTSFPAFFLPGEERAWEWGWCCTTVKQDWIQKRSTQQLLALAPPPNLSKSIFSLRNQYKTSWLVERIGELIIHFKHYEIEYNTSPAF